MKAKYIGPEYDFDGLFLVKDKEYEIEIAMTGPQMVINGQPVITEDNSAIVSTEGKEIPYSPSLLEKHWDLLH